MNSLLSICAIVKKKKRKRNNLLDVGNVHQFGGRKENFLWKAIAWILNVIWSIWTFWCILWISVTMVIWIHTLWSLAVDSVLNLFCSCLSVLSHCTSYWLFLASNYSTLLLNENIQWMTAFFSCFVVLFYSFVWEKLTLYFER